MSDRLNELYLLEQKAQKMELINEDIALKIYLEIFESYSPKISRTYESAIRLLEKRNRYDEALEIVAKAIDGIKRDEVSGVLSKFETTRNRILEKNTTSEKGTTDRQKKYTFKKTHLIGILFSILFIVFLFLYTVPDRDLDVNLEGKESISSDGSFFSSKDDVSEEVKKYPVTQAMIDIASTSVNRWIDVEDSNTIPQNETLGIAIIVRPGTSEDRAKEIATEYVIQLAGAASAEYIDLKPPSSDHLGQLYDYYELIIVVGTSTDSEDIIARGTKVKRAAQIYWRRN